VAEGNSTAETSAACTGDDEIEVRPGNRIPGLPQHSLKFGADWQPAAGSASARSCAPIPASSCAATRTTRTSPTVNDFNGSGRVGGFAVVDLTASWKPGQRLELFAKVSNLFDRRYGSAGILGENAFDAAGAIQAPADWRAEQFVGPGAPRAAWLGRATAVLNLPLRRLASCFPWLASSADPGLLCRPELRRTLCQAVARSPSRCNEGRRMDRNDALLADWRQRALALEAEVGKAVIGQARVLRLVNTAVFARGHVLLQGDVGVGKTTLLRAFAQVLGGAFARTEGTVDLMPNDLVYYTYISEQGRPAVEPGPLIRHGEDLAIFFFNEINRARPQVHALLLRVMAERSVSAFNREFHFPHLLVFADRNRVEREETFEISSAARDRFMMEITIDAPADDAQRRALMFDPRFHDTDRLVGALQSAMVPHRELNALADVIQHSVQASDALQNYALALWRATAEPGEVRRHAVRRRHHAADARRRPAAARGARGRLAGARVGMSLLLRAAPARVAAIAWLT
jgi:MoxR-like ATPase